ncbi:MAG: D-tyrosyl-tRNA(Tyr) deacylase [Deltaproteobacteria bacterium HGW-Deltaproteobacteria-20]|jgi:D-tyrosyl-tRNA(Tyr) deacylase|nr:MAG: D-tyrosyl-tRNA(Tyr) deacylase [Deltaproteobacteria bacterium HGW-Deltaproteobacteria-20]
MRAVVQRVVHARVDVDDQVVGEIGPGLVAFVGAGRGDTDKDVDTVASKVAGLRVFEDDSGKMSRSVGDVGGAVLAVSQFTVFGDVRRGRRPSFDDAMEPVEAERLFERFVQQVRALGVPVETGRFRAMMRVLVDNDGPVTILVDSRKAF